MFIIVNSYCFKIVNLNDAGFEINTTTTKYIGIHTWSYCCTSAHETYQIKHKPAPANEPGGPRNFVNLKSLEWNRIFFQIVPVFSMFLDWNFLKVIAAASATISYGPDPA